MISPVAYLAWGIVCLCTGFIQNYAGLLVTRLLLGAAEGGLFPCLTLYLMIWYKRDELAKRMSFLFDRDLTVWIVDFQVLLLLQARLVD